MTTIYKGIALLKAEKLKRTEVEACLPQAARQQLKRWRETPDDTPSLDYQGFDKPSNY